MAVEPKVVVETLDRPAKVTRSTLEAVSAWANARAGELPQSWEREVYRNLHVATVNALGLIG